MHVIIAVIVLFIISILLSLKKKKTVGFLERDTTDVLKGIAIMLILIHHIVMNMSEVPVLLSAMFVPMGSFGTAIFFMVSGYGNYFSLNHRNSQRWLTIRVLRLLISYIIVFIINYWLIKFLVPSVYCINDSRSWFTSFITLTLIPWTNWYIKIQLLVYVIYYFTTRKSLGMKYGNYLTVVILILYSTICASLGIRDYWWTSAIGYAIGILVAANKEKVLKYISNKTGRFLFTGILLFGMLIILEYKVNIGISIFANIIGCVLVILLTYIIKLDSVTFRWIGTFSFELYLTQLVFLEITFNNVWDKNIQVAIVLLLSIPLGFAVYKVTKMFMKLI